MSEQLIPGPCPCCGSEKVEIARRRFTDVCRFVLCRDCGLQTPRYGTVQGAVAVWNRRPLSDARAKLHAAAPGKAVCVEQKLWSFEAFGRALPTKTTEYAIWVQGVTPYSITGDDLDALVAGFAKYMAARSAETARGPQATEQQNAKADGPCEKGA